MTALRAAVVACSGAFLAALSTSLVAVTAPVIGRTLDVSPPSVAWVLTGYLLSVSCLLALMGRLSDVFGRRRMCLFGFATFAFASFLCAAAPTLPVLIIARVVQGIGSSALMASGPAIITRALPPERRARGLGIQLAITYAGLTLGPTLGGVLTARFGWPSVFVAVGAVAIIGIGLTLAFLEDDREETSQRELDLIGALWFAVALCGLLLALRPGASRLAPLSLFVIGGVLFVRREARHASPLLPLSLMRSPPFALGIVGALFLYVVAFVLSYLLPFHLQNARGFDPARAGVIMTAQPVTMAVLAPVSGALADRFGARWPSALGMTAMGAGLWLVSRGAYASDLTIASSLAVVGLGAGLFVAPNNSVIMSAAPRERQGTAAAMAATARTVGMTSGIALAVVLGELFSIEDALGLAAGVAAVGAVLAIVKPAGETARQRDVDG